MNQSPEVDPGTPPFSKLNPSSLGQQVLGWHKKNKTLGRLCICYDVQILGHRKKIHVQALRSFIKSAYKEGV